MNLLYLGRYKDRFKPITEELGKLPSDSTILELCFGDIVIAEFCKQKEYRWQGIDVNAHFVHHAQKSGYHAVLQDIASIEALPKSDLCLVIGSLYHFHPDAESLLTKMFDSAKTVLISEPVINLSSSKGLLGYFAKRSANAGKGYEEFRYNESSLMSFLNQYCKKFDCKISSVKPLGKDLLVKLIKNGS